MENSKIEWTRHTANLWIGCTEVHTGCDNCYARVLNNRWGHKNWGKDAPRRAVKKVWNDFKKWQADAAKLGEIHSVFVGSMMDIFEKPMKLAVPMIITWDFVNLHITNTDELRSHFFNVIVPSSPNLRFLLLTKRPGNINRFIPQSWKTNPPSNVIFGTSPVNQETADKLIPQLLEVNGKHFLSVEPMLGQVNLWPWLSTPGWVPTYNDPDNAGCHPPSEPTNEFIDWVICGGESGHGKREFNPIWARLLRDTCKTAGVPFFMKQWDKIKAIPDDLMIREFPQ